MCLYSTPRSSPIAPRPAQIPRTVFDRFHFVLVAQDWESMASSYWLKQGLVSGPGKPGRIVATAREHRPGTRGRKEWERS